MANFRKWTDKEIQNDGIKVDFDLERLYKIPPLEVSHVPFLKLIANYLHVR